LENTVTMAIRPKSLGSSNLAKIAEISICISSRAICEVADQPMLRTVVVFRVILIQDRNFYLRFPSVHKPGARFVVILRQPRSLTLY